MSEYTPLKNDDNHKSPSIDPSKKGNSKSTSIDGSKSIDPSTSSKSIDPSTSTPQGKCTQPDCQHNSSEPKVSGKFPLPTPSEAIQLPKLTDQQPHPAERQNQLHSDYSSPQQQQQQQQQQIPYFTYLPTQPMPSLQADFENDLSNFISRWGFFILKIVVLIVAIFIGLTIIPNNVMSVSKKFGIGILSVFIYAIIDLLFSFLGNHKGDVCKATCGC